MSKRAAIPDDPTPFGQAVKQNLDRMTGQQQNTKLLPLLPVTATLEDLIAAHNALLKRMQGE